jgi:membrane protein implicated in regulation of membrane protease activity
MLLAAFGQMNPWILFWLIIAILFIVVELSTVTLTSIWFAAGGVGALLVAMCGGGPMLQVVVFIVIAILLLFATRPWAKKFVNGKNVSTNADRVIGKEVRVAQRVSNFDQTGMAVVNGQEWTVRTEDDKIIIEQGELVRIIRISGVKLIVERVKEN